MSTFSLWIFLTHTSGFNSAHKGAKMVANLHVTIREKKYQECLTVISSNLLISEANKKQTKKTNISKNSQLTANIYILIRPGCLQACLENDFSGRKKGPDQVFRYSLRPQGFVKAGYTVPPCTHGLLVRQAAASLSYTS